MHLAGTHSGFAFNLINFMVAAGTLSLLCHWPQTLRLMKMLNKHIQSQNQIWQVPGLFMSPRFAQLLYLGIFTNRAATLDSLYNTA